MKLGCPRSVLAQAFVALLFLFLPAASFGAAGAPLDLPTSLQERRPAAMLGALGDNAMRDKVDVSWSSLVMEDSGEALERNKSDLYPNPSLQAYVNRLGQSLIPREAPEGTSVTFKIVEDPLPFADTLATGTVYLSTGLISLLDNESQLAFVLMHEAAHVMLSHHLLQIVEAEKAAKRDKQVKVATAIGGTLLGGFLGRKGVDALLGGAGGYISGAIGNRIARYVRKSSFLRETQLEADEFATQLLLRNGFDAREAPALMAKIGDVVRRSGSVVELAFANANDLPARAEKVRSLLQGAYQPEIARVLQGSGFRMSSPRYSQLIAELRRDNGILALERDLFVIARMNLEEAAAVRTDDPLTMYGLGALYSLVGRSDEEVARAAGYLKSALDFDEVRNRFPEVYLHYSVELLSREDPQRYLEIQKALKSFVVLFQRKNGGNLPREMRFVYDYLDLTGDRDWVAYPVINTNSEVPYHQTSNEKPPRDAQPASKPSTKP